MIYHLTHVTTYAYAETVTLSQHVVRLRPRSVPGQSCLEHALSFDPPPLQTGEQVDYFGNSCSFAAIHAPHSRLVIRATSTVGRRRTAAPHRLETPAWERVRQFSRGGQLGAALEASEFLYDSPAIQGSEAFEAYALKSFSKGRPILDAVLDLTGRIHAEFAFDPRATHVATPVAEVLRTRRGVCQDFAQLQIACLRSLGLPARYVSGYIETLPPPGKEKLAGADASHAWVSFFCHGLGWIDVDPTNNLLVSDQHVTLGWGRDYTDAAPVRGVILGSGEHQLSVSVDLRPVAPEVRSAPVAR
jgi:transglutaminase-like putative cysteine protease